MSRWDDIFDLIEETNDLGEEIAENQRRLEKKMDEIINLLKSKKEP